jgi:hypothetical protein
LLCVVYLTFNKNKTKHKKTSINIIMDKAALGLGIVGAVSGITAVGVGVDAFVKTNKNSDRLDKVESTLNITVADKLSITDGGDVTGRVSFKDLGDVNGVPMSSIIKGSEDALPRDGSQAMTGQLDCSTFGLTTTGPVDATSVTVNGAFTPPRLTAVQRDALTPATGNIVFNTDSVKLQVYGGGVWQDLEAQVSSQIPIVRDIAAGGAQGPSATMGVPTGEIWHDGRAIFQMIVERQSQTASQDWDIHSDFYPFINSICRTQTQILTQDSFPTGTVYHNLWTVRKIHDAPGIISVLAGSITGPGAEVWTGSRLFMSFTKP